MTTFDGGSAEGVEVLVRDFDTYDPVTVARRVRQHLRRERPRGRLSPLRVELDASLRLDLLPGRA